MHNVSQSAASRMNSLRVTGSRGLNALDATRQSADLSRHTGISLPAELVRLQGSRRPHRCLPAAASKVRAQINHRAATSRFEDESMTQEGRHWPLVGGRGSWLAGRSVATRLHEPWQHGQGSMGGSMQDRQSRLWPSATQEKLHLDATRRNIRADEVRASHGWWGFGDRRLGTWASHQRNPRRVRPSAHRRRS